MNHPGDDGGGFHRSLRSRLGIALYASAVEIGGTVH
jgi:hypothetical protein